MAERPEITPENYSAVYDYYEEPRTSHGFNTRLFALANRLYAPDVLMSEHVREIIEDNISLGKGALLAVNHPSQHDPFVTAGAFHQLSIEGFTEFTGFAKDELFHGIKRPIFEKTGCVPVFRQKNHTELSHHEHLKIAERLFELATHRLMQGQNVSIMPEGTNSAPDELESLNYKKIKSGIVKIAQYATDQHAFIVPIGIHYRTAQPRKAKLPRHAVVAFGEPITSFGGWPMEIKHQIFDGMQQALTAATEKIAE